MNYLNVTLIGAFHGLKGILYDESRGELVVYRRFRRVARFRMDTRDVVALSAKLLRLSQQLDEGQATLRKKRFGIEEAGNDR